MKVNETDIDEALESISMTEQKFNESGESISQYAEAGQQVLTYQETSSVMQEVTMFFQNISEKMGTKSEGTDLSDNTEQYMEYITSITNYIIELSLATSSVTQESLGMFKSAFMMMEGFELEENEYVAEFQIMNHFLLESEVTITTLLEESMNEGALMRAQTQQYNYINTRALTVLENFTVIIGELDEALSGSAESNSTSRLIKIVDDSIGVVDQFAMGMISMYQITMCEQYLIELSQLKAVLEGSSAVEQLSNLTESISVAKESVMMSIERSEVFMKEDKENENADNLYYFFSQLSDLIKGTYSLDSDSATKETIVAEVDNLLVIVENVSADPLDLDFEYLIAEANITAFSLAMQNVEENALIAGYLKLSDSVQDLAMYFAAMRQIGIYEQARNAVGAMMMTIPVFDASYTSSSLTGVSEIQTLSMQIRQMQYGLYSVTRSEVREMARQETVLFSSVKEFGANMAYMMSIEESLSYIRFSSVNYAHYTMQQYVYGRAFRILEESLEVIESAIFSLDELVMNVGEATDYEEVENITKAYNFMINFTSDLSLLPSDLREQISNYNFNTTEYTSGTGIQYLSEVQMMMQDLRESFDQSQTLSKYYQEIGATFRVRSSIMTVAENLRGFIVSGDSFNSEDVGSTDNPSDTTTPATEESGDTGTQDNGEVMSAQDLITEIKNLTDNMYINGTILKMEDLENLESYSKMFRMVTMEEGSKLENLEELILEFSSIFGRLSLSVQAEESAVQVTESNYLFKSINSMSFVIESAVERMMKDGSTAEAIEVMTKIEEECYANFTNGFAYINQETVGICNGYALEFSSSSTPSDGTEIDASGLTSAIADAKMMLEEHQGFMSAQAYQYKKISDKMEEDEYDQDWVQWQFLLSRGSQNSYILYEIDFLLADLKDNLTSWGEVPVSEGSSDDNDTLLLDIQSLLQTTRTGVTEIHTGILNRFWELIIGIGFRIEDGISVNETELNYILEIVENTQYELQNMSEALKSFGIASTRALVAQDAVAYLEQVTNETLRWIEMAEGLNDESATSSATTPAAVTTPGSTTESPSGSDNNNTELLFEEATDALMYWAFDSHAVDTGSVAGFKNRMFVLSKVFRPSVGQAVPGLNMWQHSLHEANRTLTELIAEVYFEEALERASLEEAITRYSMAFSELESYKNTLENYTNDNGDNTEEPTDTTTPSGDSLNSTNGQEGSSEENSIQTRVNQIAQFSIYILEAWEVLSNIQMYEITSFMNYKNEISDLARTGEGFFYGENFDNLTQLILDGLNATNSSLEGLSIYSDELYNQTTHVFHIAFFEEVTSLANFSINWLSNMNETMDAENGGDSNSTPTTTTAEETTSASSSSSLNETDFCSNNESLACIVDRLLTAIKDAKNASNDDSSDTTNAASDVTTPSSSSSNEDTSFMDENGEMSFLYGEVRQHVYMFSRRMRWVEQEDLKMKNETITLLEEIIEVTDGIITDIKTELDAIVFTEVEDYYQRRNDTHMADM